MKIFLIALLLLYIISPVDAWPGILDDIGCLILIFIVKAHFGLDSSDESSGDTPKLEDSGDDEDDKY